MIRQQGFTLIELCVVLIIVGILSSMALVVLVESASNRQRELTKERLSAASQSIGVFLYMKGHLPCPAPAGLSETDKLYGTEGDCEKMIETLGKRVFTGTDTVSGLTYSAGRDNRIVVTGFLPTRSLNIRDEMAFDGENHPLTYAVTLNLTRATTYAQDGGGIFVANLAGQSLTVPDGSAQYAVVFHGEDGDPLSPSADCLKGERDDENCDGDARLIADKISLGAGKTYYDDKVDYAVWISPAMGDLPQYCRVGEAIALIKINDPDAKDFEGAESNTVLHGQSVRSCRKGQDHCDYYTCQQGHFVKTFIDLQ